MSPVISLQHVSKKFCRQLSRGMWYGMADILRDSLAIPVPTEPLRKMEFWAVDDISLDIEQGERVGIIGFNGSGKTTLLKMIGGIFRPDKGRIAIRGRVGALIAVGAGFHPQLTGRENVFVNGAILGMSHREILSKFDTIVQFADIGDFLDTPVKFYSSGMFVKLGFSVAAHCDPDILLVDEVLSVGDIVFQNKCLERMEQLRSNGVTVVLVSHHMPKIGSFCERALYISSGRQIMQGPAAAVINEFEKVLLKDSATIHGNGSCRGYQPLGGAKLERVVFDNTVDGEVRMDYAQPLRFTVDYDLCDKDPEDCALAILVKRVSDGLMCFGAMSSFHGFRFQSPQGRLRVTVHGHNLVPDLYNVDCQIRTIRYDTAYAAHREPRVVVNFPPDRYLLRNLAGVFQPNEISWEICQ